MTTVEGSNANGGMVLPRGATYDISIFIYPHTLFITYQQLILSDINCLYFMLVLRLYRVGDAECMVYGNCKVCRRCSGIFFLFLVSFCLSKV